MTSGRPTVLFLVTEDWYFCSHRLALGRAARDRGWRVVVATRVDRHGDVIRDEGFELVPIGLRRQGRNPLGELRAIAELVSVYRRVRPTIVHHVAIKPVLYGSIAAWLSGVSGVVNALAGMGYAFTSSEWRARTFRPLLVVGFRALLGRRGSRLIVQNPDDRAAMIRGGFVRPEQVTLIRGSGVDVDRFCPREAPPEPVRVTMVGRMLRDKGVTELVEAARQLHSQGSSVRIVLVGDPDPDNPTSIAEAELRRWNDDGVIEWLGQRDDIAAQWAASHIAVLPSYREGLPKALVEAAACGLPLITTDVPGCRELVTHEDNGLLVPARDPAALAVAIERLASSPALRRQLGQRARDRAVKELAESIVVAQTMTCYERVLERQSN